MLQELRKPTMEVLVILSAILGVTLAIPTGPYDSYHAHQAPAIPAAYAVLAQAEVPVAATNIYAPAAPPQVNIPVVTGTLYHAQDTLGQYQYGYESSDGQEKKESKTSEGSISGHFNFISPEGKNIKLSYTAGKGGFMAEGDHLPKEVEVPEELARAYQEAHERLAKAHEEARLRGGVVDDGQYREQASENVGVEESEESQGGYGQAQGGYAQAQSGYAQAQGGYAQVQVPSYQVQAPVYQVQVPSYQVAVPSVQVQAPAPAPSVNVHFASSVPSAQYAPAPEAPNVEQQVPYTSSSYQTEIGGPVASSVPVLTAPVKSSGYGGSTGY